MRTDFYYDSKGAGRIHGICWTPSQPPVAIMQIIHGIGDHAQRYEDFAEYLNGFGFLVVAEDHMGHGKSIQGEGVRGYFHGGWFAAVEDSYTLLQRTRQEHPELPYVLFGHSMGSFMTRTILAKHPDSGISAAILCGTGWQPKALISVGIAICTAACKQLGEQKPNKLLETLVFSNYNKKVEHPRTGSDWLTRDSKVVDAYLNDPLCGFTPTAGLMRDLMKGIQFIQDPKNLAAMRRELPVLFIAGSDDPVGSYGKGVRQTEEAFRRAGMEDVTCKLYPLDRHEILNELNQQEVYQDVISWLQKKKIP